MINQGVTASDRKAFEAWFNAFNIKEMPEYQTIRDFSFAAWQAATAAKEAEIAAIKAERDALLELLVFAASTIKSEYPESQWDEYRIPEIDAAIAKAEGDAIKKGG